MVMVDNAIYVDGARAASPASLEETYAQLRARPGAMAWIGLYRPEPSELQSLAAEFGLHELIVEDAELGHQRSKIERYGDTVFTVLRPARYLDESERVEFGEVHIVAGVDFVIVIRHSETPDLAAVRAELEADPARLAGGPGAVLYAIVDRIVDDYEPVVAGLENDIDEIEDALFAEGHEQSQRIYQLNREVIEFQRAAVPLLAVLREMHDAVGETGNPVEARRRLRDVSDHATRVVERLEGFRTLLQSALTVNYSLVGQRQNDETRLLSEASLSQSEEMKKISSWAAIIFAPSLIGSIYGMNFRIMPELHWTWGYPFAMFLMVAFAGVLYLIFKKKHWL